ncbi:hypothetical protein EJ06DRAFT_534523 [Trichodelitschia bisporula]|uniref:Uncharacterized protein n=1 Tax=Trichodelitschia bisporula TaxID=703511 RepID=A0A6G1HIK5_9PEZI|nr:hypothetical protein EJ06DRAFT_534523 [Trichodelitschia bisporula]
MIDAPGPNILLWPKATTLQPPVPKSISAGDILIEDAFPSPPPTPPYTQGPAAGFSCPVSSATRTEAHECTACAVEKIHKEAQDLAEKI